jgi:uncharacterized membrane protein YagU involved in acid resistance
MWRYSTEKARTDSDDRHSICVVATSDAYQRRKPMAKYRAKRSLVEDALAGAVAGLIATVPMTVTMLLIQRMLPRRQRSTLEPKRISDDMLRKTGVEDEISESAKEKFSMAAHFGYGATTGMLYAIIERLLAGRPPLRGPLYGLAVWAASYVGWLPAARTLPPPHRRPAGRNLLLIVAHLVWGIVLQFTDSTLFMRRTKYRR